MSRDILEFIWDIQDKAHLEIALFFSRYNAILEQNQIISTKMKIFLYYYFQFVIMDLALLCGLERAPTFLVPIINPPFADRQPAFPHQERIDAFTRKNWAEIPKNPRAAAGTPDQVR
jgi:hypothetical protein